MGRDLTCACTECQVKKILDPAICAQTLLEKIQELQGYNTTDTATVHAKDAYTRSGRLEVHYQIRGSTAQYAVRDPEGVFQGRSTLTKSLNAHIAHGMSTI